MTVSSVSYIFIISKRVIYHNYVTKTECNSVRNIIYIYNFQKWMITVREGAKSDPVPTCSYRIYIYYRDDVSEDLDWFACKRFLVFSPLTQRYVFQIVTVTCSNSGWRKAKRQKVQGDAGLRGSGSDHSRWQNTNRSAAKRKTNMSCNDPAGIGCVNRCEPKKYKFATYEICDSADPYRGNKAQLW